MDARERERLRQKKLRRRRVRRIKKMCEENNVNVQFFSTAVYSEHLKCFPQEKVEDFFTKLAEISSTSVYPFPTLNC